MIFLTCLLFIQTPGLLLQAQNVYKNPLKVDWKGEKKRKRRKKREGQGEKRWGEEKGLEMTENDKEEEKGEESNLKKTALNLQTSLENSDIYTFLSMTIWGHGKSL